MLPFNRPSARRMGMLILPGAALWLAACAPSGFTGVVPPDPAHLPLLEAEIPTQGNSIDFLTRLGATYRSAGRLDEARDVLERAVSASGSLYSPARLYLALTYEDLERWSEAATAYSEYGRLAPVGQLSREASRRIPVMRRAALQEEVRTALTQEAQLAGRPTEAAVLAVFPFTYIGADPDLAPLGRALADLLVTDLAQTDRLRVLERARVQLLADEIALGASGRVDEATAARSGRLLGAGRIVVGTVADQGEFLRLEGTVVAAETGQGALAAPVSEQDRLAQFFDAQKRLVLGLYEGMGVELTTAERERVNRRPTQNLQALLAYGRGLEALDGGDFAAAAERFQQAATIDPGFQAAVGAATEASAAAAATSTGTTQLAQAADREVLAAGSASDLLWQNDALRQLEASIPQISGRNPFPESQGTDRLAGLPRSAPVDVLIRRPR